jgi:hypothetical protein
MPRPDSHAAGEPFTAEFGIWFVDPRSGAVQGWRIEESVVPVGQSVSPGGRYLVYGVHIGADPQPRWRLFDTDAEQVRELTDRPVFTRDESRYALAGPDGISIVRAEDGSVERTFPVARFGRPAGFQPSIVWSPDGDTLLATFPRPLPDGSGPMGLTGGTPFQILRLTPATGAVVEVAAQPLAIARWSGDGRLYFTGRSSGGGVAAYRAADNGLAWQLMPEQFGLSVGVRDGEPYGQTDLPVTSPDGAMAAIGVRGAAQAPLYRVYVVDTTSGAVRFWVEGAYTCGPHIWTADGRWLLVHGRQGQMSGSFLVAADGSEVRFLADYVEDLSPVDAGTAAVRGRVFDVPSGAVRHSFPIAGNWGWDFAHDPLWLPDGRMVIYAPHGGHGGCGLGPASPEQLAVRFP